MKLTYISKTDLAISYFPFLDPNSARHKLIDILDSDVNLMSSLIATGYKRTIHYFSPKQVQLITDALGSPWH